MVCTVAKNGSVRVKPLLTVYYCNFIELIAGYELSWRWNGSGMSWEGTNCHSPKITLFKQRKNRQCQHSVHCTTLEQQQEARQWWTFLRQFSPPTHSLVSFQQQIAQLVSLQLPLRDVNSSAPVDWNDWNCRRAKLIEFGCSSGNFLLIIDAMKNLLMRIDKRDILW